MGHQQDMQRYEKTERGKLTRYGIMRKYDNRHRLKNCARQAIRTAVFRGKMIRSLICERCHRKRKTFAYHLDFNKPFDIVEICYQCYRKYYC